MARYKTFVNGGNLLPSDLNTAEDDYEVAFGTYKHVRESRMRLDAPTGATYIYVNDYAGAGVLAAGATGALGALYLDPARYWSIATTSGVNPRSVYYNLVVGIITNNTAPAVTFTTGLYPLTGTAGTGATEAGVAFGTVVSGSTVPFASPAASTLVAAVASGDFVAPAAGYYAFGVVVSGSAAASSSVALRAVLQMRQV